MATARGMFDAAKHPRGFHGRFGSGGAKRTIKQVGTDRIYARLAMQEAGIRHDYATGFKKPRKYESPQAVAQYGRHARLPMKQALEEDLSFHRMSAGQQIHNALFRAKRERGKSFSRKRFGR